ncbi:flavin reductase family protein [Mycobacterium sp. AT1]|uniref:flavin reductase family protein n=1 Tax=Mycobacterium sp. AT1 TaxID=1961706 RepID=UPI0009AD52CF|nr:flavin reductase family protein [Mycobacterium sp. AT1]OPX11597.1 oxidoreductase [Mycobacterium sp. AT1]
MRQPLADVASGDPTVRTVFGHFPTGVAAIAAIVDGRPAVFVASSFQVGISAEPPLVLFAVQHTSTSWPRLNNVPRLGVSVFAVSQDGIARQLSSTTVADRFAGVDTTTTSTGAHYVDGAVMHLECHVHAELGAGDHDVILLQVDAVAYDPHVEPLIWHGSGFRALAPVSG